jgi:hypothetical protein
MKRAIRSVLSRSVLSRSVLSGLSVLGIVWVTFGSQGCSGPSIRGVCKKICDALSKCIPADCSDEYIDQCVEAGEKERDEAEAKGCTAEFDDNTACINDTEVTCQGFGDECEAESEAYDKCVGEGGEPPPAPDDCTEGCD